MAYHQRAITFNFSHLFPSGYHQIIPRRDLQIRSRSEEKWTEGNSFNLTFPYQIRALPLPTWPRQRSFILLQNEGWSCQPHTVWPLVPLIPLLELRCASGCFSGRKWPGLIFCPRYSAGRSGQWLGGVSVSGGLTKKQSWVILGCLGQHPEALFFCCCVYLSPFPLKVAWSLLPWGFLGVLSWVISSLWRKTWLKLILQQQGFSSSSHHTLPLPRGPGVLIPPTNFLLWASHG